MTRRYFRNGPATTLAAGIGASDTSCNVASASGFPTLFPYTLILDKDQSTEEVVQVTAAVGELLTITRGVDSTTAWPHNFGAVIVHGISARDADESNSHVNATTGIHGVSGALVGTTDTQTLINKTLSSPILNTPTLAGATIRDTSVIQGNPSNAQNPLSIRNTSSVEVGYVDRAGIIQGAGLRGIASTASTIPLTIQGAASQSANLITVKDSSSTTLVEVTSAGRLGIGVAASTTAEVLVKAKVAGDASLRIQELAGQTGDLLSIVDSGGSFIYAIDEDGPRYGNWINAPLTASRQTHSGLAMQYRKEGRRVILRGEVERSDGQNLIEGYTTLFTLPAGFRPARIHRWVTAAATGAADDKPGNCQITVNTDGTVDGYTNQSGGLPWMGIHGEFWVD